MQILIILANIKKILNETIKHRVHQGPKQDGIGMKEESIIFDRGEIKSMDTNMQKVL